MTPINAMSAFLDIASGLEFYGMVFFEVKVSHKTHNISHHYYHHYYTSVNRSAITNHIISFRFDVGLMTSYQY